MALKLFHLISFIFLIFLLFPQIGHAKRKTLSDKKSSPFDFIKKLKGCHKGNHTKEIHKLKVYLEKFGYLRYLNKTHANNNNFDETLESAIKTYQKNYHIKPTGSIDADTISKMTTPRCGVPDIINGTNYMQSHNEKHDSSSSSIHKVSHFRFSPGNPKWPPSKTHLTYKFLAQFPTNGMDPVARAFQKWASATHFTFSLVQENENSDLVLGFYRRDQGDSGPFDGPLGILAHAAAPTKGSLHFDADENWAFVGPAQNAFDMETIALHEIGHLLGLGHSSVQAAIMYAAVDLGQTKNLHADDIQGIRTLYNV